MENGARGEEVETPDGGSPAVGPAMDGRGSGGASERQVIRWERFLPRRSLRVLLVEPDDSTRHIVTALLRKCSYHVAEVADGLKAWEVMKEKRYSFDLVLTEVAVPSLSGIGLLSKIMSSEECKNIPVIMMSSHDSVGVVLKCMLKGAVDFLVKPVRKNELRNLWQHVWRRHCSSSYMNATDNNSASNEISANAGGRSETGENSDEGSDAQSSGSKPDLEIESQRHTKPLLAEDRNCTREVEGIPEQPGNDMILLASVTKMSDGGDKPVGMGADVPLQIQEASVAEKSQKQNCFNNISPYREGNQDFVRSTVGDNDDPKSYCQNNTPSESVQNMIVFVEPISKGQCSYAVLKKDALVGDELCETAKSSHVKDGSSVGTSPLWELSLKRPQPNGCVQPEFKGKHVLKHSDASAFSGYGDNRIHHSCHKSISSAVCIRTREYVDKCHSHISSHGTDNEKSTPFSPTGKNLSSPKGNEGEATVYFQVSSYNKENDGLLSSCPQRKDARAGHSSTTEDIVLRHPQFGFIPLPIPVGAVPYQSLCAGYGAILQPVFYPETSLAPESSAAVEKLAIQIPSDQSGHHGNHLIDHSLSLEFHHHEENHQPRHWRQAIDIIEPGDRRELSRNPVEQTYRSGSCSQDVRKGSGSNGSGEMADGPRNTGTALESGNESGVQNCNRKGLDCDRSRREAALIKFRLKRKDRCFEKKVRYYSRKKQAEQRPRVKGQFVRQKVSDSITPTQANN